MVKRTTLKAAKRTIGSAVLAIALAALAFTATNASAQGRARTWSIAVYIQYLDGSVYENVVMSGVPTNDMPAFLQQCNSSHAWGSAVRFHCYPIPE